MYKRQPLTVERFTHNPEGAAYGYCATLGEHDRRSELIKITRESNFRFASAWNFGGGFTLSSCAGIKAALDELGEDYFAD